MHGNSRDSHKILLSRQFFIQSLQAIPLHNWFILVRMNDFPLSKKERISGLVVIRAVTKALIEGVDIHIFAFCPTSFF